MERNAAALSTSDTSSNRDLVDPRKMASGVTRDMIAPYPGETQPPTFTKHDLFLLLNMNQCS